MGSNYIDTIVEQLRERLGDCDTELLRLYALLVLVAGDDVDERDVHNAWSVWCAGTVPDHRSLVPFDELTPEVQALDTRYAEAIRTVAREVGP